jgi:hypothetical protein
MSSPLAVGDLIEIVYWNKLFNQVILSTFHCRVATAPSGASAEIQLSNLVDQLFSVKADFPLLQAMIDAAGTNFGFDFVTAQRIKPTRSIYAKALVTEFGVYPATCNASNLCASLERRASGTGRKFVGRLQWAGVPTESVISGVIDADFRAVQLGDLCDEMAGNFSGPTGTGGNYVWCLPAGGTSEDYDIFDAFPQATARTMHRRTVGLGI